jgi:hypothetical protein
MHGIARMNRHRVRREAEAIIANRDRNRSRACHPWTESQKRSDNQQQYSNAYRKGFHQIEITPHNCKQPVAARKAAKVTRLLLFSKR